MRVDAHQHFWKPSRGDYAWLTRDELPTLYRDFLPEDLAPLLKRSGIDRTIAVQAAPSDAETNFLLELANETPFIAGVVGWTDLESPDAVAKLEALAGNPRLLGLRPMLQDLSDDDWLLRASVEPAIAAMAHMKLRFDALVKPTHLKIVLRFLEHHPDLAVVIDHGAKPAIASGAIDEWSVQMRDIARYTNAFCKLSGLATESGSDWTSDTLKPYVDVLIEAFGPRRLMWGSDWPVLELAFAAPTHRGAEPYAAWMNIASQLVGDCSAADRDWIFGGTAEVFYGIG